MSVAVAGTPVAMPKLSDGMDEGTVLRWYVADGAEVSAGDAIAEIETDKATAEVEAPADGVLHLLAGEGELAAVGAPIATIEGGDAAPRPAQRLRISPLARRIAAELGVDPAALAGSGPGGRIVRADVLAQHERHRLDAPASASPTDTTPPPPSDAVPERAGARGSVEVVELSRLQQTVALRMAQAKSTIPEFTLTRSIAMDAAVELRRAFAAEADQLGTPVPSYNDMVLKACARALAEHPDVNGRYREDGAIERHARVNIGFAVAADSALVVPTIFDADGKSLSAIAQESRKAAQRVRDGVITPAELDGGTFTVSNLGMLGVTSFTAVINPPQAAILAVGAVERVPVVREDGVLGVGHRMAVTLTCDHRIVYGATGAAFLQRVAALLESPRAGLL